MARCFREQQSYDLEIVEGNGSGGVTKVGKLRIKPNKILWKKKGAHMYRAVDLDDFAKWI